MLLIQHLVFQPLRFSLVPDFLAVSEESSQRTFVMCVHGICPPLKPGCLDDARDHSEMDVFDVITR